MNQQILDYIKQARISGMSDKNIRQQLLDSGWSDTETVDAFNSLIQNTMPSNNFGPETAPRKINVKRMITKGILGIFAGLAVGLILAGFLPYSIAWTGFFIALASMVFIFGLWGAKSKTKEELRAELQGSVVSEEGLTKNEKIAAWIFSIINPVITGAVMYYMWRKKYPTKAKWANRISIIVFFMEITVIILGILIIFSSK